MPNVAYCQYLLHRIFDQTEQVFFWFYDYQNGATHFVQFITDFTQASQLERWLVSALGGDNPPPLQLSSDGTQVTFSSTTAAMTIEASSPSDSLSVTFDFQSYEAMIYALIVSLLNVSGVTDAALQAVQRLPIAQRLQTGALLSPSPH